MRVLGLVVEDQFLIAITLQDMLAEIGWETLTAQNAEEALQLLDERPDIGFMLTDIRMPGMSGVQLAKLAHGLQPDLKIIFVTGCVLEELEEARSTGFTVLSKPFDTKVLAATILELLSKPADPTV